MQNEIIINSKGETASDTLGGQLMKVSDDQTTQLKYENKKMRGMIKDLVAQQKKMASVIKKRQADDELINETVDCIMYWLDESNKISAGEFLMALAEIPQYTAKHSKKHHAKENLPEVISHIAVKLHNAYSEIAVDEPASFEL